MMVSETPTNLQKRSIQASTDNTLVLQTLCEAFDKPQGASILAYDDGCLVVEAGKAVRLAEAIARGVDGDRKWNVGYEASDDNGLFIHDFKPLAFKQEAILGGRPYKDTEEAGNPAMRKLCTKIMDKLPGGKEPICTEEQFINLAKPASAVHAEYCKLLQSKYEAGRCDFSVLKLVLDSNDSTTGAMAVTFVGREIYTNPEGFASNGGKRKSYGDGIISGFFDKIREYLEDELWDELNDEDTHRGAHTRIQKTMLGFIEKSETPDTEIYEFKEFLVQDVFGRARIHIGFNLMRCIAEQAKTDTIQGTAFFEYYRNINRCMKYFLDPEDEDLRFIINPANFMETGSQDEIDLSLYLKQVGFFACLPVSPEPDEQLIENEFESGNSRQVTYRFRVNGDVPEKHKTAYLNRIDIIAGKLKSQNGAPLKYEARFAIAQLAYLTLVMPRTDDNEDIIIETDDAFLERAKLLRQSLDSERNPNGLTKYIENIKKREDTAAHIAQGLIDSVKTRASSIHAILNSFNVENKKILITIRRGIIGDGRIIDSPDSFLIGGNTGDQRVSWLKYIDISTSYEKIVSPLFTYEIDFSLGIKMHRKAGNPIPYFVSRDYTETILPVLYEASRDINIEDKEIDALSFSGQGIIFKYDNVSLSSLRHWLGKAERKTYNKAGIENYRQNLDTGAPDHQGMAFRNAVFCALEVVLLYIVTKLLTHVFNVPLASVRIIRKHTHGKSSANALPKHALDTDGGNAIRAQGTAVEWVLSRELPVRIQGFNAGEPATGYRKTGTLTAVQAGFPTTIETAAKSKESTETERFALVTYAMRPCDQRTGMDPKDCLNIFLIRVYTSEFANSSSKESVTMSYSGMSARILKGGPESQQQNPVIEVIKDLKDKGFKHIVVLSQFYMNRRFGRAREVNAPASRVDFMTEIADTLKNENTYIYPMRRAVYPALRLLKTYPAQGFEIYDYAGHMKQFQHENNAWHDAFGMSKRGYYPIYSFLTFRIVGGSETDDRKPQSGCCTYFYDEIDSASVLDQDTRKWLNMNKSSILGYVDDEGKSFEGGGAPRIKAMFRTLHCLESECSRKGKKFTPILDPFSWARPIDKEKAGELELPIKDMNRKLYMSVTALASNFLGLIRSLNLTRSMRNEEDTSTSDDENTAPSESAT
jgi:hypothetical protein